MKIITILAGGVLGYTFYTVIKAGLVIAGVESYRRQRLKAKSQSFLVKTSADL